MRVGRAGNGAVLGAYASSHKFSAERILGICKLLQTRNGNQAMVS